MVLSLRERDRRHLENMKINRMIMMMLIGNSEDPSEGLWSRWEQMCGLLEVVVMTGTVLWV